MAQEIKILAIDPGSKNTGWALMLNERILFKGNIDLWGNDPRTYYTLYFWTRTALEGLRHHSGYRMVPDHLVLESYFPHSKQRGATLIPELRGVIKLAVYQMRTVKLIEVPPGTVKKNVTGNGRATKEEVKAAINALYNTNITDHNVADAVAIGLAGLNIIRDDNSKDNNSNE